MSETVSFRQMKDGTRADYALLGRLEHEYGKGLPDRILTALKRLDDGLQGYPVSRYAHSLQSATRALRDGADDELVVAALVHDIGDDLSPFNHAAIAAAILRPYVRAEVTWIVEQHGLFQSYYYAHHLDRNRDGRDRFRDHPWYAACVNFCERWDQSSFDPEYPTEPLSRFEPMVRAIFTRPAHDLTYVSPAPT
jgi:predicted HD phosphohydrolase